MSQDSLLSKLMTYDQLLTSMTAGHNEVNKSRNPALGGKLSTDIVFIIIDLTDQVTATVLSLCSREWAMYTKHHRHQFDRLWPGGSIDIHGAKWFIDGEPEPVPLGLVVYVAKLGNLSLHKAIDDWMGPDKFYDSNVKKYANKDKMQGSIDKMVRDMGKQRKHRHRQRARKNAELKEAMHERNNAKKKEKNRQEMQRFAEMGLDMTEREYFNSFEIEDGSLEEWTGSQGTASDSEYDHTEGVQMDYLAPVGWDEDEQKIVYEPYDQYSDEY